VGARRSPLPRVLRRPKAFDARTAEALRREEPVLVHGPPGRSGGDELLRAPRLGLSGRGERRGGVRRGVLRTEGARLGERACGGGKLRRCRGSASSILRSSARSPSRSLATSFRSSTSSPNLGAPPFRPKGSFGG